MRQMKIQADSWCMSRQAESRQARKRAALAMEELPAPADVARRPDILPGMVTEVRGINR